MNRAFHFTVAESLLLMEKKKTEMSVGMKSYHIH